MLDSLTELGTFPSLALGLLLARVRRDYRAPFFTAGYALTALAALVAANDEPMAIAVLGIDAAIYAASALIFR